jgi:pilus assembly protein Flp/PilA
MKQQLPPTAKSVAAATFLQHTRVEGFAGNGMSCNWRGNTMELVRRIKTFIRDEDGITAIEYGILASVIALGIVTGAQARRDGLNGLFADIVAAL